MYPDPAEHRQPEAADRAARHRTEDRAYHTRVQTGQRRDTVHSGTQLV